MWIRERFSDISKRLEIRRLGTLWAIVCLAFSTVAPSCVVTDKIEFHDAVNAPISIVDYVPNEARKKNIHKALSNAFGFGGQNACLCIGRFEA